MIVKDNLDTADLPTTSGAALFRDFVALRDAFVVGRLRAAGAIVLAKASLSELSMGLADCINSVLRYSPDRRTGQPDRHGTAGLTA